MEESGSHQPTIGPHQGNDNPHQAESGGSQHSQSEVNSQQRGDRDKSGQTMHTNRSQSRGKSHVSHAENEKDMQCEIDELKKKLRRAWRRRSSFESESSSGGIEDVTYRQRSRTPPSETLSGGEEHSSYRRKSKGTSCRGLGNKAMNVALNQVAKSPFSCAGLRVQAFLGDLNSQLSLFIMVGQIRWSMLAILIKKWPSIQRMRPSCVRSFHPAWVQWR